MGKTRVTVEGLKELSQRIGKLSLKLQKKVYNQAAKAGGKIITDAAKAKVPVRTGTVKKSLTVRASSKVSKGLFGVKITVKGGARASNRTATRKKGSSYYPDAVERYYRFTELGTKFHPAKPYLKPGLEDKKSEILAKVKETLAAGLERETASL